jgi:aryl-phospho-beta-D-glucosidase BglC (GH1 family)
MRNSGARWLRLDFPWSSIESTRGTYNWALTDRVVNAATARGLRVLALPAYTPAWARPAGSSDKFGPTDPTAYAAFVKAAATRYGPEKVSAWEIWNEPNIANFWQPAPNVGAYTRLLKASYTAIKSVRPTVPVITGGTSPATDGTNISPNSWAKGLYANAAKGYFDALGHHPYSFPAMPSTNIYWSAWTQTPSLRDVMVANGDSAKQVWLTEFGAPTGLAAGALTEQAQAQYVSEGATLSQQWPWAGPLFLYSLRNTGTNTYDREQNFGLLRQDRSQKPAWATFTQAMTRTTTKTISAL